MGNLCMCTYVRQIWAEFLWKTTHSCCRGLYSALCLLRCGQLLCTTVQKCICKGLQQVNDLGHHARSPHHNRFTAVFWDHPGEPVPEENFWTLWCKGRLTEADTPTIQLGATPSRLTSAHLHHPPHIFLQAGCSFCCPTNSVKALKATSAFRLGRRH